MQYLAGLLNHISDPTLNDRQPIFLATGTLGDISAYTAFFWFEPVYFKVDDTTFGAPTERFGHFVGLAHHVGHAMTFNLWIPSTNKIVPRSNVRTALDASQRNERAGSFTDDAFIAWRQAMQSSKMPSSYGENPSRLASPLPIDSPPHPPSHRASETYALIEGEWKIIPLKHNYGEMTDAPFLSTGIFQRQYWYPNS